MVLAHQFATGGAQVILLDSYPTLGGNHISMKINDMNFDIGSFVFSSASPFFTLFPECRSLCLAKTLDSQRLTPQGRVSAYPIDIPADVLARGLAEILRTGLSAALGRLHRPRVTVADYARQYIGARIFSESGLEHYVQRLCGAPATQVDYVFAAKRMSWIARASSPAGLLKRLKGREMDAPTALVRPEAGFSALYEPARRALESLHVVLKLGRPLNEIRRTADGFTVHAANETWSADHVVSSLPLDETRRLLGLPPGGGPGISLRSLMYSFSGDRGFSAPILYNFAREGIWKRLTMHSDNYGRVGSREYFSVEAPLIGSAKGTESIAADFQSHVRKVGLFRGDLRREGEHNLDHAYPRYVLGAMEAAESAMQDVERCGVALAGRQGRFDYIGSEAATTKAMELAAGLLRNTRRWPGTALPDGAPR